MADHGTFVWNELMTGDVEAAKRFYGDLFGWSFAAMPMADGEPYWVASLDGEEVAGIMGLGEGTHEPVRPQWFAYLEVDDVDDRVEEAMALGAKLLRPIFDVPNVGRIAIVEDPTGAVIGWMTSSLGMDDDLDEDDDLDLDDDGPDDD